MKNNGIEMSTEVKHLSIVKNIDMYGNVRKNYNYIQKNLLSEYLY